MTQPGVAPFLEKLADRWRERSQFSGWSEWIFSWGEIRDEREAVRGLREGHSASARAWPDQELLLDSLSPANGAPAPALGRGRAEQGVR